MTDAKKPVSPITQAEMAEGAIEAISLAKKSALESITDAVDAALDDIGAAKDAGGGKGKGLPDWAGPILETLFMMDLTVREAGNPGAVGSGLRLLLEAVGTQLAGVPRSTK